MKCLHIRVQVISSVFLLLVNLPAFAQTTPSLNEESLQEENSGCRIILRKSSVMSLGFTRRMLHKNFVANKLVSLGYTIVGDEARGPVDESKADLEIFVERGVPYGWGAIIDAHYLHSKEGEKFNYFYRQNFIRAGIPIVAKPRKFVRVSMMSFPPCPNRIKTEDENQKNVFYEK